MKKFFIKFYLFFFTFLSINSLQAEKLPIIYHPNYDIAFYGLEKLHSFDTGKYSKVHNRLARTLCQQEIPEKPLFKPTKQFKSFKPFKKDKREPVFYEPVKVSDKDILLVHTQDYLNALKKSDYILHIAEMNFPLSGWIPNGPLQSKILNPMKYATGGTILGCQLAIKKGWAINLSGGYHHAKKHNGGGFCYFNDIAIGIIKLQKKNPNLKVLIIDLDAHQGNGHEEIFQDNENVFIFDVYNKDTYPHDSKVREYINFEHQVRWGINDQDYLNELKNLKDNVKLIKPDLIIYNAGTDIYEKDPLGGMNVSKEGIIKRDEIVFESAIENNVPILMLLSGGYHEDSYNIIAESIENLWNKKLIALKESQNSDLQNHPDPEQ